MIATNPTLSYPVLSTSNRKAFEAFLEPLRHTQQLTSCEGHRPATGIRLSELEESLEVSLGLLPAFKGRLNMKPGNISF